MVDKVLSTLRDKCGVNEGSGIIVALSGGADSVSLLYALHKLREKAQITLMAAHVNHNLRGEESDRDEAFVRNLCEELDIELFVLSEDVGALAEKEHKSIELCGREVRYEFFEELADVHSAFVATAHTLSDAQETMLYNIARGTTLHGLCSIPYKRDYIIRPLLDVTREEVEAFCSEDHLDFVQDSTNFQEEVCARNKIRLKVMPQLRSINQGFHSNFSNLREDLMSADDFISSEAEKLIVRSRCRFGFDACKLTDDEVHCAVLRRAIAVIIAKSGAKAEYNHILRCSEILRSSGAVALVGGYTAVCTQGVFRIVSPDVAQEFAPLSVKAGLSFFYGGKEYSIKEIEKTQIINKKLASYGISCDTINNDTVIRNRCGGDTFAPVGRGLTKPLRKLQNELKIPEELRDKSLVIANGSTVLWAEYIGVSAQGIVNSDSEKGIYIEIKRG